MTEQKAKNDEILPSAGGVGNEDGEDKQNKNIMPLDDDFDPRQGFLGGFERSSQPDVSGAKSTGGINGPESAEDENTDKVPKLSIRELREKKVAAARQRYLKRMKAIRSEQ